MLRHIGYCTNVHAGANLEATRENLVRYALEVKRQFNPRRPMGIGLWLTAEAARKLVAQDQILELRDWLNDVGLVPFTFNGFPFGDFHQRVVKHRVYHPTWFEKERLDYTLDLAAIQHAPLPAGLSGSISTLPIAWSKPQPEQSQLELAARQLRQISQRLAQLERETGRLIHVCLEPEPGCYLQYSADVIQFFERHLLTGGSEREIRRHIRVCHDVCHAAVMFEPQQEVVRRYLDHGILIGKVQVSSAICLELDRLPQDGQRRALRQLAEFAEDRYLHQTVFRTDSGEEIFFEDLSEALQFVAAAPPGGQLRVHFHMPIYLAEFGWLKTSQPQILECIQATRTIADLLHFEVETYAWSVLPPALRQPDLASGIAQELTWLQQQMDDNWQS